MISIPAQLKQHYVLAPAKLRLVTLIGLLRKVICGFDLDCGNKKSQNYSFPGDRGFC